MTSLLSCYFPTTVVIIDDDESFVEIVKGLISDEIITIKAFTNPIEALEYVNDSSAANRLDFSKFTREGEDDTADWHTIMLNINELHNEIYNADRFRRISTIIVDYSMPELNGVTFCSKIVDPNIQKILLTGIGDGKIAIDAFNNGYINQFVRKDYSDFVGEIKGCLNKSLYRYFKKYTDYIAHYLTIHGNNFLNDPAFVNFFRSRCLAPQYIEYYMLDCFGSYLLLEDSGKTILLSVLTEDEMQKIVEIGIDSGEIDPMVLEDLQSREYMLVHYDKAGLLPPVRDWGRYLSPARKLTGYQTYYFSVSDFEPENLREVKTYADFCKLNGK